MQGQAYRYYALAIKERADQQFEAKHALVFYMVKDAADLRHAKISLSQGRVIKDIACVVRRGFDVFLVQDSKKTKCHA